MKNQRYLQELQELEALEKIILRSLKNAPTGTIRCAMAQGKYPQYYILTNDSKEQFSHWKYLPKKEIDVAKTYSQKEYDTLLLKAIQKRKKELNTILSIPATSNIENEILKLPPAKQCLIQPYLLTDSEYEQQWLSIVPDLKNSYPIENGFITEKGEIVRSKSEKIIADKLFIKGIPYKYETALKLPNGVVFFPDFSLLNRRTREEFYLEHFGMMDNPEYCKSAIEKINMYEENGIYLGEKLFVTFESSLKPIDIKHLDSLLERILE